VDRLYAYACWTVGKVVQIKSTRVEGMADSTRGKGDRKEPPDDEAALSARLQRLGERLENASRPSENVTGPRQTADASAFARGSGKRE